jgi:hypothetical protein
MSKIWRALFHSRAHYIQVTATIILADMDLESDETVVLLSERFIEDDKEVFDTESKDDSILRYKENSHSRFLFLILIEIMYFHLGAAYYSFPMWLNQILTDHVDMTRSELSLFGVTTYVSLGLCGTFVLWFSSWGYSKISAFKILTSVALLFLSIAWLILVWLVWTTENVSKAGALVGLAMVLIGLAVGVFYLLWFGQVMSIVKTQWHFLFNNTTSMVFTAGAAFYLSLKLIMTNRDWMLLMMVSQLCVVCGLVGWVFVSPELIFARLPVVITQYPGVVSDDVITTVETADVISSESPSQSTKQFLLDLFMWRRQFSADKLESDINDVSSRQFYFILASYIMVLTVSTTFMSNLGPMTSDNDTVDDNGRAELLVMIYCAVGQTFGRFLVPVITHSVDKYLEQMAHSDFHTSEQTKFRVSASMRVKNNTSLALTLVIGIVITAALLCLVFIDHISFTLMSTVISVAYGMTWSVVSSYPSFFYQFDFTLCMCTFQIFGAAGTLTLVLLISVMKFGNDATSAALLVGSISTVAISLCALIDRWSTAPAPAKIHL